MTACRRLWKQSWKIFKEQFEDGVWRSGRRVLQRHLQRPRALVVKKDKGDTWEAVIAGTSQILQTRFEEHTAPQIGRPATAASLASCVCTIRRSVVQKAPSECQYQYHPKGRRSCPAATCRWPPAPTDARLLRKQRAGAGRGARRPRQAARQAGRTALLNRWNVRNLDKWAEPGQHLQVFSEARRETAKAKRRMADIYWLPSNVLS